MDDETRQALDALRAEMQRRTRRLGKRLDALEGDQGHSEISGGGIVQDPEVPDADARRRRLAPIGFRGRR